MGRSGTVSGCVMLLCLLLPAVAIAKDPALQLRATDLRVSWPQGQTGSTAHMPGRVWMPSAQGGYAGSLTLTAPAVTAVVRVQESRNLHLQAREMILDDSGRVSLQHDVRGAWSEGTLQASSAVLEADRIVLRKPHVRTDAMVLRGRKAWLRPVQNPAAAFPFGITMSAGVECEFQP